MKYYFTLYLKNLIKSTGASLAEFAVVTAMMATFIGTSAPKYSDLMEYGKERKSFNQIDKILTLATNFYNETARIEGRGRFPGQDKFDMPVGGYDLIEELNSELFLFETGNSSQSSKWASVFGINNPKAPAPDGTQFFDDAVETLNCNNCSENRFPGHEEWLFLSARDPFVSPYQDGHYIYIVIPGYKISSSIISPKLIVADAENPAKLHKILAL